MFWLLTLRILLEIERVGRESEILLLIIHFSVYNAILSKSMFHSLDAAEKSVYTGKFDQILLLDKETEL